MKRDTIKKEMTFYTSITVNHMQYDCIACHIGLLDFDVNQYKKQICMCTMLRNQRDLIMIPRIPRWTYKWIQKQLNSAMN